MTGTSLIAAPRWQRKTPDGYTVRADSPRCPAIPGTWCSVNAARNGTTLDA